MLRAHPALIVQLFQNLIDNAIRFRGEHPPRIHVSAEPSADRSEWCFRVVDNGIGIDPRQASTAFALFQNLHRQEDRPGKGVGLAICKKIVASYGGDIRVEPAAPRGSQFIFTIPVRLQSDRTPPDNPPARTVH